MIPIVASAAVSIISEIYNGFTAKAADSSAQSAPQPTAGVNFSTMLNQADATKAAAQINSTLALQHTADLSSQLSKSADVTAAINAAGASGPMQIQVDANGDADLSYGNGKTAPITLSNDTRSVAQQLYQAKAVAQNAAAANTASTAAAMSNTVAISIA